MQKARQPSYTNVNQIKQSPMKALSIDLKNVQSSQIQGLQQSVMLPFFLFKNNIPLPSTNKQTKDFYQFTSENKYTQKIYLNAVNSLNNGLFKQSVFYSEKLFFLCQQLQKTQSVIEHSIFLYGLCLFNNQEYQTVINLFQSNKQIEGDFALLIGRCYFMSKQYEQAIDSLAGLDNDLAYNIKGQSFEALENKKEAVDQYQKSLIKNPVNVSVFTKLLDSFLVSEKDKLSTINQLKQSEEEEWIRQFYKSVVIPDQKGTQLQPTNHNKNENLKKLDDNLEISSTSLFNLFSSKNNIDFLCIEAKKAYYAYDLSQALALSQKILSQNSMFFDVIPIYSACLVELEQVAELYNCAHNLIDNYPQQGLSWLVVGNYYFLTKKYEIARKHFQRSIQLDSNQIFAWIGLAHSYAVQDESDQAMSVYRSVSRQFPGCYQSHIYIGMEYLRTNNLRTALQSFQVALDINPSDPMTYNEIGVVYFKQKKYQVAKEVKNYFNNIFKKKMFEKTLSLCGSSNFKILEIALQNLASCCRKLRNYKEAINLYEKCIQFNSTSAQTYFALAFTQHISGEPNSLCRAIQYYHKSLSMKPDQPFVQEMLGKCLSEMADLGLQEFEI